MSIPGAIFAERPSYRSGFAHNASESAYPDLWRGLRGAWCPELGNTGQQLLDASGLRVAGGGAFVGSPTWTTHRGRKAIDYGSGAEDYYVDTNRFDLDLTEGGTWAVWVYASGTGQNNQGRIIDKGGASDGTNGWTVFPNWQGGSDRWQWWSNNDINNEIKTADGSALLNTWTHLTVTVDPSNFGAIYIDGVLSVTKQNTGALPIAEARAPYIGRANRTSGTRAFAGFIGETLIWDRVLTPRQIRTIYAVAIAPFRQRARLVLIPSAAAARNPHNRSRRFNQLLAA